MALGTIAGIAGAIGGIGGAIKGLSGSETSSSISLGGKTRQQMALEDQSRQQYNQQRSLADQFEKGIMGSQNLQDLSREQIQGIISGQSLNATPEELARINQIRQAQVDIGQADVNKLLDDRLAGLSKSAGVRGLRGQAYSQLQTDSLRAAAEQLGQQSRAANLQAAQQAFQAPTQRIQTQSPFLQNTMSLADQMRIQAQSNRQALQNPALLGILSNERMAQKTQTSGSGGDFFSGFTGALGGIGGGIKAGNETFGAVRDLFK